MKFPRQNFSFPILKTFTIIGITTFSILTSSLQLLAQWTDDFSDGEFLTQPEWTGDRSHFQVENEVLILNAPAISAASSLTVPIHDGILETRWMFRVSLSFNPSASNYARVYLAASHQVLSNDGDGYFVMVGSSSDDICLYRQSDGANTKIIDGPDGILNFSKTTSLIQVTCDAAGNWTLSANVNEGGMQSFGSVLDPPDFSAKYFGLQCIYTATRSNGFSFDDFEVQHDADDDPPFVTQVSFIDPHTLELDFNESLDQATVVNVSHYTVGADRDHPVLASLVNGSTVLLDMAKPFISGARISIRVANISDVVGNQMVPLETELLYFEPHAVYRKDIIFSELMPDPSPPGTLPEAEFIEIFNRSSNPVDLRGWHLSDGTTDATLPKYLLLPDSYLVLVEDEDVEKFGPMVSTLGLSDLPSLNNSADAVVLRDTSGMAIDSVSYDLSWYGDTEKSDGGWSLEIIDPDNLCGEHENWDASSDPSGGTPGRHNSVAATNPDLSAPRIELVLPVSEDSIRIVFNEKLSEVLPAIDSLEITPYVGIKSLHFADRSLRILDVALDDVLTINTLYTLHAWVSDCAENSGEVTMNFALPGQPSPGDLLINEILFNPTSTGVDFVELYNSSNKFIDLSRLFIATMEDSTHRDIQKISDRPVLVFPSEYIVLTSSPPTLESEYIQSRGRRMIELKLPPMPDDRGVIALIDQTNARLEEASYSESYHDPFLEKPEGVSLERVSFITSASKSDNWKSASHQSGYATPGYVNSASRNAEASTAVSIVPESFQPSKGGFAQLLYAFKRNGLIGNAAVYSPDGRRIKVLLQNQSLGTSGFIRWDGDMDDGRMARVGLYQVWLEIYDRHGIVATYRKRVALAGDF